MDVKTYPEMDIRIKSILRTGNEPHCLYAAQRIEELESYLEKLEKFEAELILCDDCWRATDGLSKITQKFYDKCVDLQTERNNLLGRDLGADRKFNELMEG